MQRFISVLLLGGVLSVGCGPERGHGGGGGGNGGGGGDLGTSGGNGGNGETPDLLGQCGIQSFALQKAGPPDLLVVLDRSGSMSDPVANSSDSKWKQMTDALNQVVAGLQTSIKFGLEFFPSDDSCGTSATVAVNVTANAATPIATAIAGKAPGGSTPTADAITRGADAILAVPDTNPKYLLLATDGDPTCNATLVANPNPTCTCQAPLTLVGNQCCILAACIPCSLTGGDSAADAINSVDAAAKRGVNTFVIGIATDSSSETTLNAMAQKGNTARPGPQQYYPVANKTDLVNAIQTIAGQIVSCTLALQMPPPAPDRVDIVAGSMSIPRDTTHANGWDYGPNNMSVIFYGSYCQQFQTGQITSVSAIYDCPPVQ